MSTVAESLSVVRLGEPQAHRNPSVVPLVWRASRPTFRTSRARFGVNFPAYAAGRKAPWGTPSKVSTWRCRSVISGWKT